MWGRSDRFYIKEFEADTNLRAYFVVDSSGSMNFSSADHPTKIEFDLRELYDRRQWSGISMRFIQFGRDVCDARKPQCYACELDDICPYPDKTPPPE